MTAKTTNGSYFDDLNAVDVSSKVEKKNGLSYLSWAWAWAELKKKDAGANYTVYENRDGLNYHTDGKTAYVKVGVTTHNAGEPIEHIEYLPVMDFKNKSIPVENITSFDVNKAIQRALTKAIARHGLGLYIYAGEDLPETDETAKAEPAPVTSSKPKRSTKATGNSANVRQALVDYCKNNGLDIKKIAEKFKLNNSSTDEDFITAFKFCQELAEQYNGLEPLEI